MTTAKMRIKMGPIEIDYEGTEDFLKQELPAILKAISTLYNDTGARIAEQQSLAEAQISGASGNGAGTSSNVGMSVTSIAAKIGVKTGPDLVVAAAARLTRGGMANIPRGKLLEEMKQATGFFKTTYRSNLSSILLGLVKDGKLQETAKDTYALSIATKSDIEARLA